MAPAKAGWWFRFKRSWACQLNLLVWASRRTICSRSTPGNLLRRYSMRADSEYMRLALGLARRGYGNTSPNPMVGAVLLKRGEIIGRGWHHRAGEPHGEIEAIQHAIRHGNSVKG